MNLYYQIWMDAITRLRSNEATKNNWQFKSMISMSMAMTFNFVLLMVILQKEVWGHYFYQLKISFLSGFENYVLTILFLYALPCIFINYLL
jgi:hypothetical protein